MLIWRGVGILVPVLVFAGVLGVPAIADALFGAGTAEDATGLYEGFGAVLAGLVVLELDRRLRARPGHIVIDEATGQRIELRPKHDLFWVPLRFWGLFLVVGTAIGFLLRLAGLGS